MLHRIPGGVRRLGTAAALNAGTAAHNAVQLDANGKLPAVDGSQLTGISASVDADLEVTLAEMAMAIADNSNTAQFLGGSGNRVADSFDVLTYVDTGGATNLDTGTAGLLKPTLTYLRVSPATPSMPLGGTAANINDNNPATSATTNGLGNLVGASVPARIIGQLDLGSVKTVSEIQVVGLSCSSAASASGAEGLYYSADGSTWTQAGSGYTTTTTPTTFSSTGSFSARYVAVVSSAENWGTITHTIEDLNAFVTVVNNVIVSSTALVAASVPTTVKLTAQVHEIDAITLNTDLVFYVSRDGGTTYTAFTVSKLYTVNNLSVYDSSSLDISGQPSSTSMKWKLVSANNKNFELQGVNLYWK